MAEKLEEKVDKLAEVVTRLAGSVDEMRMELRDSRSETRGLRGDIGGLKSDTEGIRADIDQIKVVLNSHTVSIGHIENTVDQTNAQFGDVIKKVIEHEDKIESLDGRVSTLELGVH